ncbi:hypothetical protein C9I98_17775 [Photobacterium sanctipauli]|uniref:Uncharacterized protein n=1 Tax=Photobacterium sanctipauli TaxID=1342794 RepID=A0A2T3NPU2_9GAMM|nr:hypothetical protein C9I98_17775 [Photobacterium sanctipauli]
MTDEVIPIARMNSINKLIHFVIALDAIHLPGIRMNHRKQHCYIITMLKYQPQIQQLHQYRPKLLTINTTAKNKLRCNVCTLKHSSFGYLRSHGMPNFKGRHFNRKIILSAAEFLVLK